MRLEYDPEADAAYITLREGVPFAFTLNRDDARNIDYGPDNLPIGVEFLGVSHGVDLTDLPQRGLGAAAGLIGREAAADQTSPCRDVA